MPDPVPPGGPTRGASAWQHVAVDVAGTDAAAIADARAVQSAVLGALGAAGSDMTWITHRFEPHGVSLVGVGPRLRVAVHTWPERGAATLDLMGDVPELPELARRCAGALSSRR